MYMIIHLTKGETQEYLTTHSTLEEWPGEESMTIGIACVCDRGESIVIASDMRATYGSSPGRAERCVRGRYFVWQISTLWRASLAG